MRMYLLLLFVLFVFTITPEAHTMDDSRRLLKDKLDSYDKRLRPLFNQSQVMEIFIGLEVYSISDFDEVEGQLTIAAVIYLAWTDEYMTWKPDVYDGLRYIILDSGSFWTPTIALVNNAKKLEKIADDWQVIRFTHWGNAYYLPAGVFTASCNADITFYPFDNHWCKFSFAAWGFSLDDIKFKVPKKVSAKSLAKSGTWEYIDSRAESNSYIPMANFAINIKRKPTFVIFNTVVPIVCMSFLNMLVFLIPVESGERMSYSITVVLAIAVFFTILSDTLPRTSSPMSIFTYYLVAILVINVSITFTSILSICLYHKGPQIPASERWNRFARFVGCKPCTPCRNREKYMQSRTKENDVRVGLSRNDEQLFTVRLNEKGVHEREIWSPEQPRQMHPPLVTASERPKDYTVGTGTQAKILEATHREIKEETWRDVSNAVDKFVLGVFMASMFTCTLVFFVIVIEGSEN